MAENQNNQLEYPHLEIIQKMIGEIKFGSITIIVQDGKVIQIDKTEKRRLKN